MTTQEKPFQIFMADNWDYHEISRVPVASCDTLAEAIAECQSRVDADLRGLRKPGLGLRAGAVQGDLLGRVKGDAWTEAGAAGAGSLFHVIGD